MSGAWNPVSLDQCPDCGYLLTGLPEQGICPECGLAYGPDLLVLYGWERKSKPVLLALIGTVFVTMGAGWWLTSVALGFMLEFPLLQTMGLVRVMSYVQPLLGPAAGRPDGCSDSPAAPGSASGAGADHAGWPGAAKRHRTDGTHGLGPPDPRAGQPPAQRLLPTEARFVGFVPDKVRSEIVAVSVEGGGRVADAIERRVRLAAIGVAAGLPWATCG